ncbi:hypothetical protein [uncultured Flavobacterium sp.]|uniref:hypothetical protein n=1 Tax=uncultured Flavobacterium sp. TaxID=165435 RepID=UPI0030EBA1DB
MKTLITLLFLFTINIQSYYSDVYICDSKGAKKYHYTKTCGGLNACKHQIVKKSKSDAQDLGLTLCGWED